MTKADTIAVSAKSEKISGSVQRFAHSGRSLFVHRVVSSSDTSRLQKLLVGVVWICYSTANTCHKSTDPRVGWIATRLLTWALANCTERSSSFAARFACIHFYSMKTGVLILIGAGSAGIIAASCCLIIPPLNHGTIALTLLCTVRVLHKCSVISSLLLCIFPPFWNLSQFISVSVLLRESTACFLLRFLVTTLWHSLNPLFCHYVSLSVYIFVVLELRFFCLYDPRSFRLYILSSLHLFFL